MFYKVVNEKFKMGPDMKRSTNKKNGRKFMNLILIDLFQERKTY